MRISGVVTCGGHPVPDAAIRLYIGNAEIAQISSDDGGKFEHKDSSKYLGQTLMYKVTRDGYESTSVSSVIDQDAVELNIILQRIGQQYVPPSSALPLAPLLPQKIKTWLRNHWKAITVVLAIVLIGAVLLMSPPTDDPPVRTIVGELLRFRGEDYFIRLTSGQELLIKTDNQTSKDGNIVEGDRVEISMVGSHITSIRKAR